MIVVLDRQHSGQPRRPADLGARADLDEDGLVGLHEHEAMWTPMYGLAAELELRRLGHQVYFLSHTDYADRHTWVNALSPAADVYVAMHLNAGGGDYSAVFYDYRSPAERGAALAEAISEQLAGIPLIGGRRRVFDTDYRQPGQSWRRNAHSTIKGVRAAVGIVYEPLFIDSKRHRPLFSAEGMQQLGAALAQGIHAWGTNRRSA